MPVARRGDPDTSWAAARSVEGLRESQRAVLALLRWYGPMTDETIALAYAGNATKLPRQSPSGMRTRRRELVDQGLVVDSQQRETMESGREAIVWRALAENELNGGR